MSLQRQPILFDGSAGGLDRRPKDSAMRLHELLDPGLDLLAHLRESRLEAAGSVDTGCTNQRFDLAGEPINQKGDSGPVSSHGPGHAPSPARTSAARRPSPSSTLRKKHRKC